MDNTWNFAGEVKWSKVQGTKYKKLSVLLALPSIKVGDKTVTDNTIFISIPLDSDPSSRKGKRGAQLESQLASKGFLLVRDATLAIQKRGVKDEATGEWSNVEEIGVNASLFNTHHFTFRTQPINVGTVTGRVQSVNGNRVVIANSYRNIKDNTYKTRDIDLFYPDASNDLVGKTVFTVCELAGQTPNGDKKVYGSVKQHAII